MKLSDRIRPNVEAAPWVIGGIKELERERDTLAAALEKLAKLGNGDKYGNSDGNMIAIAALAKVKGEQE